MKLLIARRIAALVLSIATLFALIGFNPSMSASAASTTTSIHVTSAGHSKLGWFHPLLGLPDQPVIRCILHRESTSTMVRPNRRAGTLFQFGPFQFTTILWNRWAWVAGVGRKTASWYLGSQSLNAVTIPAYQATLLQQAKVFATVDRYDGLAMWTNWDGC